MNKGTILMVNDMFFNVPARLAFQRRPATENAKIVDVVVSHAMANKHTSFKLINLQNIINTETFMSKVVNLEIDGNAEKALPKDIAYDPVSDEPIHIDFMRIVSGKKIILQIPVKFINHPDLSLIHI